MVSASVGFKSLGTQYTLTGRCSVEVKHRVAAAWGKFHSLWALLGKRDGNLHKRLRLFDCCVTQTLLWCSESWLVTEMEKRLLRTTQNAMLRRIAGPRRRPDEDWIDWVRRSTQQALAAARVTGIRFWVEAHLSSKWCWAGHVLRITHDRLAFRALTWRDSEWQASEVADMPLRLRIRRPSRTHWFRFEDELRRYASKQHWSSWQAAAQERDENGQASKWLDHCRNFIKCTV